MDKHIEKVQDFVKENKNAVIAGSVATGVALLFLMLRGGKKPVQQTTQGQQQQNTEQEGNQERKKHAHHKARQTNNNNNENNLKNYIQTPEQRRELVQNIVSKIEVKYIGQTQTLDLSTISAVLEHSIDLAESEYIQLTIENRKQRRAVMRSDIEQYDKLILDYNEQVEKVLIQAQEDMQEALGIERDQFEDSVLVLMERGLYQQMYMLQAAIRQKIKEKIPASRDVTMEETKQVIQYQVKVLKDKPDFFKNVINKLQGNMELANMIPMVLNTMLQDLIYEQFQIEEEDQMRNIMGHQILNDPEIHDLLMEIEEAMYSLMGSMGMGQGQPGEEEFQ